MAKSFNEALIPLSEISKKFSYTQDHLAYLCRRGLVYAERKGKKWFTDEASVYRYQKALELAGKPVLAEEQNKVLKQEAGLNAQKGRGSANSIWGILFETLNRRVSELVDEIVFAAEAVFSRYRSVLLYHTQTRSAVPQVAYAGINIGLPPSNLPVGEMPQSLTNTPFYKELYVTAPLSAIALFAIFSFNPGLSANIVEMADNSLRNLSDKIAFSIGSFNYESNLNKDLQKPTHLTEKIAGTATTILDQASGDADDRELTYGTITNDWGDQYNSLVDMVTEEINRGKKYLENLGQRFFREIYYFAIDDR